MAFLDTSANDRYSTRALNAAAVVVASGGGQAFQKFHDLLYAHQPPETGNGLTDAQLVSYAAEAGATGGSVATDIKNLTYGDWVKQVTDQASKDGVTGTPTVFVDGKKLADLSPAALTAAVDAAKG
jgi:protein-disulfide isomerase